VFASQGFGSNSLTMKKKVQSDQGVLVESNEDVTERLCGSWTLLLGTRSNWEMTLVHKLFKRRAFGLGMGDNSFSYTDL